MDSKIQTSVESSKGPPLAFSLTPFLASYFFPYPFLPPPHPQETHVTSKLLRFAAPQQPSSVACILSGKLWLVLLGKGLPSHAKPGSHGYTWGQRGWELVWSYGKIWSEKSHHSIREQSFSVGRNVSQTNALQTPHWPPTHMTPILSASQHLRMCPLRKTLGYDLCIIFLISISESWRYRYKKK